MITKILLRGLVIGRRALCTTDNFFSCFEDIISWNMSKDGLKIDNTEWIVYDINGLTDWSSNDIMFNKTKIGDREVVRKELTISMQRTGTTEHEFLELPVDNSIKYFLEITTDDNEFVIDDVYLKSINRTNENYLTVSFYIGKINEFVRTDTYAMTHASGDESVIFRVTTDYYSQASFNEITVEEIEHIQKYPRGSVFKENGGFYSYYAVANKSDGTIDEIASLYGVPREEVYANGDFYVFKTQTKRQITAPIYMTPQKKLEITHYASEDTITHTETIYLGEGETIYPSIFDGYINLYSDYMTEVYQGNIQQYEYYDTHNTDFSRGSLNATSVLHFDGNNRKYSNKVRHDCNVFGFIFKKGASAVSIDVDIKIYKRVREVS